MTLNSKTLAVLLVVIMISGIFGSSALGWWQTTSSKLPASYAEGEFAGQANPADIRGSYTFGDVANSFAITPQILAQAFGVQSASPAAFQVKELESIYADSVQEIGTASVRLFVALYSGLPYDLSTASTTYLPQSATDLLLAKGSLSAAQMDFLNTHTVASGSPLPQMSTAAPDAAPQVETTPTAAAAGLVIKGKTTFGELISAGMQQALIEQLIGGPLPSSAMTLKDYATSKALDFETLKSAIQAEMDKLKK
jgi:hypothetical protein